MTATAIRLLAGAVAVPVLSLLLEAIMIRIDQLPRDANGIIQGAWRIVHEDPTFCGALGAVPFEAGVATIPTTGRVLQTLVAVQGPSIFIEPWDDELPAGWTLAEWHARGVDAAQLAELERAPWRTTAGASESNEEVEPVGEDAQESVDPDGSEASGEPAQPEDVGTSPEIHRNKRRR